MSIVCVLDLVFWLLVVLIVSSITYLIYIPRKNAGILAEKYESKIHLLNSVVSVCTIISIFVGIWSVNFDRRLKIQAELENRQIVIENLIEETEINLDLIRELSEWEKHPGFVTTGNFKFFYLDKIKDVAVPREVRRLAINITNDLQQANLHLEIVRGSEVRLLAPAELESMNEISKTNYKKLNEFLVPAKPKLITLKDELNKLSTMNHKCPFSKPERPTGK